MAGGLFTSLFEKGGIYNSNFAVKGASPPTLRTDIRLGGYGQKDDDDDDDDDEAPKVATPQAAKPAPQAAMPAHSEGPVPFWERDLGGIPVWLIAIGLLGFTYVRRRKNRSK